MKVGSDGVAIMDAIYKAPPRCVNSRGHGPRRSPLNDQQITCACGCGELTPIATFSKAKRGIVRGEPLRWMPGHYHRRDPQATFRKWVGGADDDGCWPWLGRVATNGYGRFTLGGRSFPAHRWAYEEFVAPVPAGLELDHKCRNRACVNPAHLEPVTHRENVLRGNTLTAANAAKTHCIHGHEFTPENTYAQTTGGRGCRECRGRTNRERSR